MGDGSLTFSDVHSMASEASALPDQSTGLRKKRRDIAANKLIANRLLAVRVELVGVGHLPSARSRAVVV